MPSVATRVRIPLGSPRQFSLGNRLNKGFTGAQIPHFRYPQSGTNVAKSAISDCFLRNNAQQSSLKMTPFFYPARKNWRVQIPASETETGKRTSRFFPTKEEAEEFIQEHYKAGSVQLAELSLHEKHVLGVIRQSSDYTPDLLLDAWRDYRARIKTYHLARRICSGNFSFLSQQKGIC
jgi:hypothetical protein